MILGIALSSGEISRLKKIVTILMKYGLNDLVDRLEFKSFIQNASSLFDNQIVPDRLNLKTEERVRCALEEMGTTFIKLGQIMATRVDLFSQEWISEFEKLQDNAPKVPIEDILQEINDELGAPVDLLFSSFDKEPLAAASIAQVHKGILRSGEVVVIKVRRPDIKPVVELDLKILSRLAHFIENNNIADLKRFKPTEIVKEFSSSMKNELDLSVECRNAELIQENFRYDENVVIPKVFWELTTQAINVQELLIGIPGKSYSEVSSFGLDRRLLAQRGADTVLKMILEDGIFHADPHPGNIFYLNENKIGIIDFGMIGHLSSIRREQIVALLYGLITKDTNAVLDILLDWSPHEQVNTENLTRSIENFIHRYHGVPLKEIELNKMLGALVEIVREHHLTLPPDLLMVIKALIPLESMARNLDPDFDMVSAARPFLENAIIKNYLPGAIALKGIKFFGKSLNILSELPFDLKQLIRVTKTSGFKFHVDVENLINFGHKLDSAASRISISAITAALIIGSSIVMTVDSGPKFMGLPLIGALGFILSFLGGLWILFSIWRGDKDK